MLARKLSTTLTIVLITAVLAGCGSSGSGVSAGSYVKSICAAVGPFEKDVQSRSSALNLSSIKSAAQGKTALVGFLNAVVGDTDRAVSQLQAAGSPNVKNGKTIAKAVVSAFAQLKTALGHAATQAGSLPTTSPTAFKNAAVSLGGTVRTSMGGIVSSLGNLKSPELEKAAATEPTCKTLSSG